jgi:hypothetical protein
VLVASAAAFGLSTRHLKLNLGPGDSPFVSGFEPDHDVADKVGWHWTTYDAAVDLPFETGGADVDVTLRYARMFGEEAVVDVRVAGIKTDAFRARGGEVRATTLRAAGVRGAAGIAIRTDSHERRNMGLRMDGLALDVSSGAPFKLRTGAALRPVIAAALLFFGLLALGSSPLTAGGIALCAALGFALRASINLFGAWQEVRLLPAMLMVSTPLLLLLKKWLVARMALDPRAATGLAAASLAAMAFRLALVFHPDFYYPDLLTHARVVEAIRNEGPSFFLHPANALNAQGAWTKPVMGSVASLPYAVMFHTPFAILTSVSGVSIDGVENALKAASCLISVLPILLSGALAARLGLPPAAALLLCLIPTYVSRLSFALLPALFGHVFDLVLLLAIAAALADDSMTSARSMLRVWGALVLGHLAYTSSVVNEGLFMGIVAALFLLGRGEERAVGLRLLLVEGVAAVMAFVLYYRHFVGDVFGLAHRILGLGPSSGTSGSVYPIESFWGLLLERTYTFFGWSYFGLALLGLVFGGALFARSNVTRAWALSYLALIFLRAKIPDVFRYGHETLFLTPLVALLAGTALILGFRKGGVWRIGSLLCGVGLGVMSLWEQWLAIAEQLANAL